MTAIMKLITLILTILICQHTVAQKESQIRGPIEYVNDSTYAISLKAYIFFPAQKDLKERHPAIVIFHGGGWSTGEPPWQHVRLYSHQQIQEQRQPVCPMHW